jgi:mono/diheme cytochrome c family protein
MIAHAGMAALAATAALLWPLGIQAQARGPKLTARAYEGWRQYSAHCARCHGQDVVGNPVAADLLTSVGPGGPMAEPGVFGAVVKAGRPKGGMPGFGKQLTDEQIGAVYVYVKGRADGKIAAGRPEKSGT